MAREKARPWLRQANESDPAYEAFRVYLNLGPGRRLRDVSSKETGVGKSWQLVTKWSGAHDWVERVRAFDVAIAEAETDGLVSQVAFSRDANLALMDKLRGLLDSRLDAFIETKQDPTIRWTQACVAMTKIEANALMLKDDKKTNDRIDNVMELVEKALNNAGKGV